MSAVPFFVYKLRSLARVIENPSLLRVRRKGVPLELFEKINLGWLRDAKFATLLDIGAAVGEFSRAAHVAWPGIKIFAFEPIPASFVQLQQTLSGLTDCQAINCAIGEKRGEVEFQQSTAIDSSSLLRMADLHRKAFPHSAQTQTIKVQMERLDDVTQRLEFSDPLLIKIDVQGYESKVLDGGQQTVSRAKALIIETSFEPLYEGQVLFPQIYDHLRSRRFAFRGVFDQIRHPSDGRILQADAIFLRE